MPASKTSAVSSGLMVGVIVATLIFPLVGLVMGGIYASQDDPRKKTAGKVWLWVGVGMSVLWFIVLMSEDPYYY